MELDITTTLREGMARKKVLRKMFPLGITAVQLLATNIDGKPFVSDKKSRLALSIPYTLMEIAIVSLQNLQEEYDFVQKEKQIMYSLNDEINNYYISVLNIIEAEHYKDFIGLPEDIEGVCNSIIAELRLDAVDVTHDECLVTFFVCEFIADFVERYTKSSDLISCEPLVGRMRNKCNQLQELLLKSKESTIVYKRKKEDLSEKAIYSGNVLERYIKQYCFGESFNEEDEA